LAKNFLAWINIRPASWTLWLVWPALHARAGVLKARRHLGTEIRDLVELVDEDKPMPRMPTRPHIMSHLRSVRTSARSFMLAASQDAISGVIA
jgi:hypothetical protein